MRYTGKLYRPPSEAHSYILQATIGCSWNKCTYCDMYRDKPTFRLRPLAETLEDIDLAARRFGPQVEKVFVADGDALILPMDHWEPILARCAARFPRLRQVSAYAMARNILDKGSAQLSTLREAGLRLLYIGPESGDPLTLRRIAKGSTVEDHIEAARLLRAANIELSAIFLLGAGGIERSEAHAAASAALASAMDPAYLSALTLTLVEGTPLATLAARGRFVLPDVAALLGELRTFIAGLRTTAAVFRTNHASNYLPLAGTLPQDSPRLLATLDAALRGERPLRPDWARGL